VKAEGNFMSIEVKFAQEVLVMVKGLCPWANTGKTAAEKSVQYWVHSLFIASGTGNRSIRRAHQKPQELDAEATGFWTSKQSPIEKLG